LKVNGDAANASHGSTGFQDLEYQRGFGNHFSTEVLKGALPVGQNSPLKCPYGLYAEQISGTAFTVPRMHNQRRSAAIFSF
jgi:homogentisate 1,2-dioxygenase